MKSYLYLFFIVAIIATSCKEPAPTNTVSVKDQVEALNQKWESGSNIEDANALISMMAEYMLANPEDHNTNASYLRRTTKIYERTKEYLKAAQTIVLALRKYYASRHTESNIADLVRYYKLLDNNAAAETTMNGYLMVYPNGAKAASYTEELADRKINLVDQLTSIANEIVQPREGENGLNADAVEKYVGVTEIFALTNSTKDTLTADYLLKAGRLSMTIGKVEKALECYQWIHEDMPNSKESPSALFQHAFLLDNQIGKLEQARGLYERFLKTYPDHHFANDAKFQLTNLGKSDAQIIEEFNKKNAKN